MGYAIKEFPEYGAIGCGLGGENCPPIENAPKDVICLPLSRRAFSQTTVVALRLEDLLFVSLPGEPTTAIGARVKELAALVPGVTQAVVVGYAQDHFGYILEEKDYLRLGYEPTVSPWGWKFGDFIVGKANEAVALLGKVEPTPLLPPVLELVPRVPLAGTLPPGPVAPVGDTERLETARFTFQGGDPTLGTPDVFLEREEGGGFVTVMATPTRRAQVGPELVLRYDASPTQANTADAPTREHRWTVEWETLEATPLGTYRVVAQGQAKTGTTVAPYEVRSAPFAVTAAKSVGSSAVATLDAAGTLQGDAALPAQPLAAQRQRRDHRPLPPARHRGRPGGGLAGEGRHAAGDGDAARRHHGHADADVGRQPERLRRPCRRADGHDEGGRGSGRRRRRAGECQRPGRRGERDAMRGTSTFVTPPRRR